MLSLNFYKIRTGIDIRPLEQSKSMESNLRFEQIIQTIQSKSEIEWMSDKVYQVEEANPADLGAYKGKVLVYVFLFGLNKNISSWTASALKISLGNMRLPSRLLQVNSDAIPWIGGLENNISCEKALFNLRPVRRAGKV